MGFYSGAISKIEPGHITPDGQMWDGTAWVSDASAHIEQYLRWVNDHCTPVFMLPYASPKQRKLFTMHLAAGTIKMIDEKGETHIYRGFFQYKDRILGLIRDGDFDPKELLKSYDPAYNIYDERYLQYDPSNPDTYYIPSIVLKKLGKI